MSDVLKKLIGNTIKARQNGELPEKTYKQVDKIESRWSRLEEQRDIKAASREVWDE